MSQRSTEVDTLRGLALFGICIVNVPFLAMPFAKLGEVQTGLDGVAAFIVALLFQGKFFILFSFLFGWGFAIQMLSAQRRETSFVSQFLRRLAGLFLIGVAHAVFVFFGDILVLYALLGLLLLPMRAASPETLMRFGAAFVVAGLVSAAILAVLSDLPLPPLAAGAGYLGGFSEAISQRLVDWPYAFAFNVMFNGPLALAAFFAGLAAAKVDFFVPGAPAYKRLRAMVPALLVVGGILNVGYALSACGFIEDGMLALVAFSGIALGGPCLSAIYLVGAIEAARRGMFQNSTVAAGRMSLTAYVAEGVIAGFVFNGVGLGLYGQVGAFKCLVIAILVFGLTHFLCVIWLKFYQQGPLEMLLRVITRGPATAASAT